MFFSPVEAEKTRVVKFVIRTSLQSSDETRTVGMKHEFVGAICFCTAHVFVFSRVRVVCQVDIVINLNMKGLLFILKIFQSIHILKANLRFNFSHLGRTA